MEKPVPKYYKIYEELLQEIEKGVYEEYSLFPSDTELVRRFQVSRGTVREAIKLLFRQGYLVREQGKGTFVTYQKIQQNPDTLIGFTELMEKHNIKPSARLLVKKEGSPPSKIRKLLQLGDDEKVFRVERLRFGNSHPLIIERSWFVHSLFSPIAEMDIEKNSIYGLLYANTDTKLGNATQQIEAVSAGNEEHKLLEVEIGTPLLLIKRLIKTTRGEFFQYSEDIYRSDRINFTTETVPYSQSIGAYSLPLNLIEEEGF